MKKQNIRKNPILEFEPICNLEKGDPNQNNSKICMQCRYLHISRYSPKMTCGKNKQYLKSKVQRKNSK